MKPIARAYRAVGLTSTRRSGYARRRRAASNRKHEVNEAREKHGRGHPRDSRSGNQRYPFASLLMTKRPSSHPDKLGWGTPSFIFRVSFSSATRERESPKPPRRIKHARSRI